MKIETFEFNSNGLEKLSEQSRGRNWPVVYMIYNETDLYIGETTSAKNRMEQHLANPEKQYLKEIKVVFDDLYNKSVVLDFEQKLIKYCKTDRNFVNILNKNTGQSAMHEYYDRENYYNEFRKLWKRLIGVGIAKNNIDLLENLNMFKFSPYTSLTEEQNEVSTNVINCICDKLETGETGHSLINGCAGTGKTILAISIINSLVNAFNVNEKDIELDESASDKIKALLRVKKYVQENGKLKIGFIFPMIGIRKTIAEVFEECGNGLSKDMVIGPYQVKNDYYDILFVDESHRLSKRKNIMTYKSFDDTANYFGLDKMTSNQLDFIMRSAKYKVLFYDKDQSVKGSDITHNEFLNSLEFDSNGASYFSLQTQMRCSGGDEYINYIKNIINCNEEKFKEVVNYDFKMYEDIELMINRIKELDKKYGLCRNVAGYSWKWNSQVKGSVPNDMKKYNLLVSKGVYDIDIDGHKYIWNLVSEGWITRKDAVHTIGCIHTTQGFDLNYVGVIFGQEIDYNPMTNTIEVDLDKFYDVNVKKSTAPEIVKEYIINTYTTIMARGIKGCYVYACNKNLREYLKKFIKMGD